MQLVKALNILSRGVVCVKTVKVTHASVNVIRALLFRLICLLTCHPVRLEELWELAHLLGDTYLLRLVGVGAHMVEAADNACVVELAQLLLEGLGRRNCILVEIIKLLVAEASDQTLRG